MIIINKTMDRNDLLTEEAKFIIRGIDDLIIKIYSKGLNMTNWFGYMSTDREAESQQGVGIDNRGPSYESLPGVADDGRFPWYLYWEIYTVLTNGPALKKGDVVLDAGGTSSLFSSYLASLGAEIHSIDFNDEIIANGNKLSLEMGWNMSSYHMDMRKLDFPTGFFDHAYSICVFEHLDFKVKQLALEEIARCLKPGGILSITFDYKNPAPDVYPQGPDTSHENQLKTLEDVKRSFLSTQYFELIGNKGFFDNGKTYLVNHKFNNHPYTFGAIFLQKRG